MHSQDQNNGNSNGYANLGRRKNCGLSLLGEELQATTEYWEKENQPLPGMSPLTAVQC